MNNLLRNSLATAGALACLLGVAAAAEASPARAETTARECREPVRAVETHERWIHLWLCDDGWHGQITSAAAGDSVWLVSGAGTDYGRRTVSPGQTRVDTPSVGQFGGPWKACGRKAGELPACTAAH